MERGEDKVAGVGGAHRSHEADGVAHFTDHDDVGILAENVFERVVEGLRIEADFALFDDGLVVLEDEFNRVFHRDDVLFLVGVDVLDHRRKRGGFAGAG